MSSLRRLAKDHATLHASLPPNYLFPPSTDPIASLPDDLTQLHIYLTGPTSTPYAQGLWLLQLRMPSDYPKSPPKATFRTRIFHPNVDENSGVVCLETLKRDWDPKLTLKDILITISCLLIQPNPDSALNEKAGVLVREDYGGFERQAKLMTKIHAPIPTHMRQGSDEARRRGEDQDVPPTRISSTSVNAEKNRARDESIDASKENEPSTSQHKQDVLRRPILGKRPLAELPVSSGGELEADTNSQVENSGEPLRKSPKHTHPSEHCSEGVAVSVSKDQAVGEARSTLSNSETPALSPKAVTRPPLLKAGSSGSGKLRSQARIGIRRL